MRVWFYAHSFHIELHVRLWPIMNVSPTVFLHLSFHSPFPTPGDPPRRAILEGGTEGADDREGDGESGGGAADDLLKAFKVSM